MDPLGHCFRSSLRGIKVFVTFKKADYQGKIETSIFASQPHIKMERLSSGPSRALLSQFPSGDKFSLSSTIIQKRINWTPRQLLHFPSGNESLRQIWRQYLNKRMYHFGKFKLRLPHKDPATHIKSPISKHVFIVIFFNRKPISSKLSPVKTAQGLGTLFVLSGMCIK